MDRDELIIYGAQKMIEYVKHGDIGKFNHQITAVLNNTRLISQKDRKILRRIKAVLH